MPATLDVLLGEDHRHASAGGDDGCMQARGSSADDEQIAVRVDRLVARRIWQPWSRPETGGPPDEPFIEVPRWPDEGLVVEAGRPQRRCRIEHAADIELDTRPAILGPHFESLAHGNHRRACVRLDRRAGANGHERIGFLDARRQGAARAMKLHASADNADPIGEQRRSDGVAGKSGEYAPIPPEQQRARAIDAAAGGKPVTHATRTRSHQCATPDAAPSSTSAPIAKRPRPNSVISSCGRSFAIVQAMVSPPAGIAL